MVGERTLERPAGMVTETELERSGVLTRSLHSRALIVRPLGQRPAGVTRR